MEKQRNGVAVYDSIDERRRKSLEAAISQLKRAVSLNQNCQLIYDITSGGTIKAKITLHIDLNTETQAG